MNGETAVWKLLVGFVAIVAVVLGVFYGIFYLWNLHQVGPGERAVMLYQGIVDNQVREPGLYYVNPLLKRQQIRKIEVRPVRNDVIATAATKDLQEVNINVAVNWRVEDKDVMNFYLTYADNDRAREVKLIPMVQEIVKSFSATYNAEEIITKRQEFKSKIEEKIKRDLGDSLITVDAVSIVNVEFSPSFSAAIEQKQIAEQQAKQAEYTAKKAEQDAQAAINYAKGQAESQRLQAQALDDKILFKLWIDKWNGVMPVYSSETMPIPFKQVN